MPTSATASPGTWTGPTAASTSCPYMREGEKGTWYKGTANAIYQNINFLETYDPEYVLILSGDHVYKMDYTQLLRRHKEAARPAPSRRCWSALGEGFRFGVLQCGRERRHL